MKANTFVTCLILAASGCAAAPDGDSEDSTPGVIAQYRGTEIDLVRDGWGDAAVCAELGAGDVRCYDTSSELLVDIAVHDGAPVVDDGYDDADADAGPGGSARATCPNGWACVWQLTNKRGRMLQFRDPGSKILAEYGFQNKTSACHNRRSARFELEAEVTGFNNYLSCAHIPNLATVSYPDGGSWDNRTDYLILH